MDEGDRVICESRCLLAVYFSFFHKLKYGNRRPGAHASVTNQKLRRLIFCFFPKTSLTLFPPVRGNPVAGRPIRRSGAERAATKYTKAIVEASSIVVVEARVAAVFTHVVQVTAKRNL